MLGLQGVSGPIGKPGPSGKPGPTGERGISGADGKVYEYLIINSYKI